MIHPTLACNLDHQLLAAALPLFESEKVGAIEWSFDTHYHQRDVPHWFLELISTYSDAGRLIGHGVYYSLFSGRWTVEQQQWVDHLQYMARLYPFDHVTEHFGFMTGEDFHKGAPMSVPFTTTTLAIGQDRLRRMQQACACPVGVENLAFSFSIEEVKLHGQFLHDLVAPIHGFIILDLHNIYCQLMNFDITADELLALYPLDMVREIHISGGSWEDTAVKPDRKIRRDTHDGSVPEEVFQLLGLVMDKCAHVKYVVLEQLGTSLQAESEIIQYQQDFYRMHDIVEDWNRSNPSHKANGFTAQLVELVDLPLESPLLYQQQAELTRILETASDYREARSLLNQSSLAYSEWRVEAWTDYMLETAIRIAQKWKDGFSARQPS